MNLTNSLYAFTFYFMIFSFSGWCGEVFYHSLKEKSFVNRGFLHGPYCPIYGFVGIILLKESSVIHSSVHFHMNLIQMFLLFFIIASIAEYLTATVLNKLFHRTWWDYSENLFNYKGRICLSFSLLWGVLGVILIKVVKPLLSHCTDFVLAPRLKTLILLISLLMCVDLFITLFSLKKSKTP